MIRIQDAKNIIFNHQKAPPIQTVPIAHELGANVFSVEKWSDNISGMIKKNSQEDEYKYSIYVNANHSEARRRFTIAHEIAHLVLHNHLIGDGISDDALYRSGLSGAIEAQANKFAADILMPWHLVNKAIIEGTDTITDIAILFKVSKSAMSIRLGVPFEG